MKKKVLVGNWKMHKSVNEAVELASSLEESEDVDIIIAPSFISLKPVGDVIERKQIDLAAQNMFYKSEGAFTGEISPPMLMDVGVKYVILGHSERRYEFGEDDNLINNKVLAAHEHGLKVILCVGEKYEERKNGNYINSVRQQLAKCLNNLTNIKNLLIAYEPVWSIGTGMIATEEQLAEMHVFIRDYIAGSFNSESTKIIYGGSVKPENTSKLLSIPNIDGFIVGGASLDAESFNKILKIMKSI